MEGKGLVAELQRAAICPACRGHFKDPVILDCDHSYCRACITRHWEAAAAAAAGKGPQALSCPQCKAVFERKNLRTNVKLAVEVKITQHLNAKTAQVPLVPKSRRRRGGWKPVVSIQEKKARLPNPPQFCHRAPPSLAAVEKEFRKASERSADANAVQSFPSHPFSPNMLEFHLAAPPRGNSSLAAPGKHQPNDSTKVSPAQVAAWKQLDFGEKWSGEV
ncbi:RING finger protein 39 [Varanus komodoensis]|nr:RING finger protein 39 [Varanus komodoensis]